MNILFYVEPHPIRNELTHFNAILLSKWGKKILQWYKHGVEEHSVKIACHQFSYMISNNQLSDLMPHLIPTNYEEESLIQQNLLPWGGSGIALWEKLMKGIDDDRLFVYKKFLSRIKREIFDFDVVIFWGINEYVAAHARYLGAKTLFMELSSIRSPFPSSVYIDKSGVNGFSSVAKLEYDVIKNKAELLPPVEYLLSLNIDNPLSEETVLDAKYNFTEKNLIEDRIGEFKKRILVPLQIGDDSNILLGSDYNNTCDFVKHVLKIFEKSDFILIFKPHPGARNRGGVVFDDHYNSRKAIEEADNAIWYDEEIEKHEYISFIRQHDAIVTINSSVGFEGMLLGLPVFPLGKAIYKPVDYNFDIGKIPYYINFEKESFSKKSKIISKFILNTVFFKEDVLLKDVNFFFERVSILCEEQTEELIFDSLIGHAVRSWS